MLSDFGGAAVYSQNKKGSKKKKLKDVCGSSYYVAPEVLISEYDEKCDIWSIGVLTYTLLAGRPPFEGWNELEIVKAVKSAKFDINIPELYNTSDAAKDFIIKMLKFNPQKRLTSEEALRHNWIKLFD